MAIGILIKIIHDIMRKDVGVDVDAQRINQIVWLLFLLMGMCDRLEESIESGKGKQTDLLNALMSQV
jgi:type I restriction-modification system DNA methylase subunit